jgi:16S rRNA G966 N2-methylase RsmD
VPKRSVIDPISTTIRPARQQWARYYGVHPYFTRRAGNVVQTYIEHYSRPGDTVLDPFGGAGVTAIEAMLSGRRAIHNDLNPFANFLVANIADTLLDTLAPLQQALGRIEAQVKPLLHSNESASESALISQLQEVPLPPNIRLPRNSDVDYYRDLFTVRQLAGLAWLRKAIDDEPDDRVRGPLLLAWSASLAKLNKTFISTQGRAESRGGPSIFSIYRYKVAARPVELPIWETFHQRFLNVLAAKKEVLQLRDYFNRLHQEPLQVSSEKNLLILEQDAAALADRLGAESVDYIFTDPPYGGHIAYLDLSVLWNHWLGFPVTEDAQKNEIIVGGQQGLSEDHYRTRLADSIRMCLRVLKPERWFSVVFQHWDVSYFAAILDAATADGAELKAAVTQEPQVIWSMHKKKNRESVLGSEMILTFYKPARKSRRRSSRPAGPPDSIPFDDILDGILEDQSTHGETISTDALFNRLVVEAWRNQSLAALSVSKDDFVQHLRSKGWQYDPHNHVWSKQAAEHKAMLW